MKLALLIAAFALLLTGCGGGSDDPSEPPASTSITTTARETDDPGRAVEAAVRRALTENLRLSQYISWHNRIPAWATRSTRGAALAELRFSARDNARARVRARFLHSTLKVSNLDIDPSYERATAVVSATQRARVYRGGRPEKRVRVATERAHIELRRIGADDPPRFAVWKVRVL